MNKLIILLLLIFSTTAHAQTWGRYDWIRPSDLNDGTDTPSTGQCVAIDSSNTDQFEYIACGSGSGDITRVGDILSGDALVTGGNVTIDSIGIASLTIGNTSLGDITLRFKGDSGTAGTIIYEVTQDTLNLNVPFKLYDDDGIGLVDTFGDFAVDNNAWAGFRGAPVFFDGTATVFLIGVLASDIPENLQTLKWNTGGTITWENDIDTSGITAADTCVLFSDGADNPSCDTSNFNYNKTTKALSAGSFIAAPSVSPTISFLDSDVGDGGTQGLISLNCPKTGSGAEGCEITFSHQVSGVTVDTIIMGNTGGVTLDTVTITTSFSAPNLVSHADILDSDQADTKCIWFENPTASDDFKSIWQNSTANDFLITGLKCDSDQTIDWDLQIDDGTPADVNGTDIQCVAGEAEDTTLSGDTTLAVGEELDLAVTSVANTPTYVSICWTGNWVD